MLHFTPAQMHNSIINCHQISWGFSKTQSALTASSQQVTQPTQPVLSTCFSEDVSSNAASVPGKSPIAVLAPDSQEPKDLLPRVLHQPRATSLYRKMRSHRKISMVTTIVNLSRIRLHNRLSPTQHRLPRFQSSSSLPWLIASNWT